MIVKVDDDFFDHKAFICIARCCPLFEVEPKPEAWPSSAGSEEGGGGVCQVSVLREKFFLLFLEVSLMIISTVGAL